MTRPIWLGYGDLVDLDHGTAPCPAGGPDHLEQPASYLERHCWAQEMLRTHDQHRCPNCQVWVIWEERPPTRWWCDDCDQQWTGTPVCPTCDGEPSRHNRCDTLP